MKYTIKKLNNKTKKDEVIFESDSNFNVLIGKNGSGKTTLLKKMDDKCIFEFSGKPETVMPQTNISENIKETTEGAKAKHKIYTKSSEDIAKILIPTTGIVDKIKHKKYITKIKGHLSDEDIFGNDVKLRWEVEENTILFKATPIFNFDGIDYEVKDLPSGVKKVIEFYFVHQQHPKGAMGPGHQVYIFDEPDNFLHPKWIKFMVSVLKDIANSTPNVLIIFSTHSPEVIFNIGFECESIKIMESNIAHSFNEKAALDKYNEVMKKVLGHKALKWKDVEAKIKSIFSFDLSRFILSSSEDIMITEGITDQMFFKDRTNKLVFNAFGFFNFSVYLAIVEGFNFDKARISFLMDGDGDIGKSGSKNEEMKNIFIRDKYDHFIFENDLEKDLYKSLGKIGSNKKFELLVKHRGMDIKKSGFKDASKLLVFLG